MAATMGLDGIAGKRLMPIFCSSQPHRPILRVEGMDERGQQRGKHMRILGIGVIIGALLLASAAEADKDWYVLSLGECRISSDLKNPAAFIIDLKAIGRQYHVEDRRDATGRIVASFVTDETIGAQIAFFRTIDLCLEERENIRSQQQQENSDLKNKYR